MSSSMSSSMSSPDSSSHLSSAASSHQLGSVLTCHPGPLHDSVPISPVIPIPLLPIGKLVSCSPRGAPLQGQVRGSRVWMPACFPACLLPGCVSWVRRWLQVIFWVWGLVRGLRWRSRLGRFWSWLGRGSALWEGCGCVSCGGLFVCLFRCWGSRW